MLAAAATPALAKSSPHPDFASLARSIDTAVADKHLPSIVAVVFDERGILWSHLAGYSDVASKTVPTLNTRYRLGSMAKSVTSTVLAIAEQKRLVSLDAPAQVRTASGFRRVPLRSLLNMEAGLAQAVCYDGISGSPDPNCAVGFDSRFAVAMTGGMGRYSYSNMGPQLAADALALKAGKPFERVACDLLFAPAGIAGLTYDHSRKAESQATDYERDGKAYAHDFNILPAAGAGLEGSAQDLVRFGQLHLNGTAANGRQLLSRRTLALLHSAPNGGFYGFGWGRIGSGKATEVLISDGQVNGGQAMLLINPVRRVGAVVMSNAAHDELSELAFEAMDTVVPGTSVAFAAAVETARSAHLAKVEAFLPPAEFNASGLVLIGSIRLPIRTSAHENRLAATVGGKLSEQAQAEEDEGFRGWDIACPAEIAACSQPGAKAKLWLSRDAGGLGGQLQVTSFNGQLPYLVRLRFH